MMTSSIMEHQWVAVKSLVGWAAAAVVTPSSDDRCAILSLYCQHKFSHDAA